MNKGIKKRLNRRGHKERRGKEREKQAFYNTFAIFRIDYKILPQRRFLSNRQKNFKNKSCKKLTFVTFSFKRP
jgi:hypothetical protein